MSDVCRGCGACCFFGAEILCGVDDIPEEMVEIVNDGKIELWQMKMVGDHCIALTAFRECGIYDMRPTVCRQFDVGSTECWKAIAKYSELHEKIEYDPNCIKCRLANGNGAAGLDDYNLSKPHLHAALAEQAENIKQILAIRVEEERKRLEVHAEELDTKWRAQEKVWDAEFDRLSNRVEEMSMQLSAAKVRVVGLVEAGCEMRKVISGIDFENTDAPTNEDINRWDAALTSCPSTEGMVVAIADELQRICANSHGISASKDRYFDSPAEYFSNSARRILAVIAGVRT